MRMKMLNQASAVDAPIASLFHAMRLGRRATDQRRWAKSFMRWHFVSLIVALFAASDCQCQEKNLPPPPAQETNSLSSLESMLVGTWRWDVPAQEETNAFMQFRLSADRSWSSLVHSDNPLAKPDEQSGAWFVHERTLVLRIANTKLRLVEKMAFALDISSITPRSLVLTNTVFGDVTWTRIAQRDGAANRSQPVTSETNRRPAAARSGR